MTKLELVREVAARANDIYKENMAKDGKYTEKVFTHCEINSVIEAFANCILENYETDSRIPFPGVGTFQSKHIDEREGVVKFGENAGSTWKKPAYEKLMFKVSGKIYERE